MVDFSVLEDHVRAVGPGAFGSVEYDGRGVILRTSDVKTTDMSGSVRLYFNPDREQVLSGRRYDVIGSGTILLRAGVFYRVQTTIEVVDAFPSGIDPVLVLHPDLADIALVTSPSFGPGPVCFTLLPYRKMEVERMTSFVSLSYKRVFDVDGVDVLMDRVSALEHAVWSLRDAEHSNRTSQTPRAKKKSEVSSETTVSDELSSTVSRKRS